jgi:hypothetical protein
MAIVKPKAKQVVPSEIADKLQTMKNNKAAENYKLRAKGSMIATPVLDTPKIIKPKVAPKEEVPSDIADALQTMKNNRAAKNYTKANSSGYAGISFDKD